MMPNTTKPNITIVPTAVKSTKKKHAVKSKYEDICNRTECTCTFNHSAKNREKQIPICFKEYKEKCSNYLCKFNHLAGYNNRLLSIQNQIENDPIANPEIPCHNFDECNGRITGGCYHNHDFAIHCFDEVILNGIVISHCIKRMCCNNHSREHITNWRLLYTIPTATVSDAIPEATLTNVLPEATLNNVLSEATPSNVLSEATEETVSNSIDIIIDDGTCVKNFTCDSNTTINKLKELYGVPSKSHVFGPESKLPLSGKKTLCELNFKSGTSIRIKPH